ncbi:MAG: D-alanine--D-alanine ligase [Treponema sp.]|nr:D-alanine--D-alanine ligase [Treponema sp.]
MTIAVIYGGKSGEHEISLMSGAAIARHIHKAHDVVLIAITKDGRWFLQDGAELERIRSDEKAAFIIAETPGNEITVAPGMGMNALCAGKRQLRIDVAFPALHGTYGEDGTVQGLLEMADMPYVGCGVMASALTMDKEKTKALLAAANIPVVPYVVVRRTDLLDARIYDALIQKAIDTLCFPLFVKPCCAGSSDGASKASNEKELSLALMEAFNWDDKVLIEKAVHARELECAVTGNATTAFSENECETVNVYGPGEIMLTHEFYDYNAKYTDSDSVQIPAQVSKDVREQICTIAERAYKLVDASGLCRVDFFLDKDSGALYLNEINALPGFTAISMFPKLCEANSISFTALTELLIEEAVLRYKSRSSLQTSR